MSLVEECHDNVLAFVWRTKDGIGLQVCLTMRGYESARAGMRLSCKINKWFG